MRFVDMPLLKDYLQKMVKMSPLQSYSIEVVQDDADTRVIGSAAGAEQTAAGSFSLLAGGAEMRAATGNNDLFDGDTADQAGLSRAHIYLVLQLKETADAVGIHVVGDG